MEIVVRRASGDDVAALTSLYDALEAEMAALRPAWPLADGLAHPAAESMAELVEDPAWHAYVAALDGVPVGFLFARDEALLPQAGGEEVASIRYIFTDRAAREVGVGEALMGAFFDDAAERGVGRYDAHVSPGHREAKNFFEANGFKARSIVMHRSDR